MTRHPINKFQRKLIAEKKHKFVDEKKVQKDRPSKIWRKLSKECLKEQETQDELTEFTS